MPTSFLVHGPDDKIVQVHDVLDAVGRFGQCCYGSSQVVCPSPKCFVFRAPLITYSGRA